MSLRYLQRRFNTVFIRFFTVILLLLFVRGTLRPRRFVLTGKQKPKISAKKPKKNKTKQNKSSCVNARGMPTAAYQVLLLLSYLGGGGTYLGQGYLPGGTPILTVTYLGLPPSPHLDLARVTPHLGVNRLKTLPSPILRMRSVKKRSGFHCPRIRPH